MALVEGGKGLTLEIPQDSAEQMLVRSVEMFLRDVKDAIDDVQSNYDDETGHGALSDKQDEWSRKYE